jgi:hypothetical protein
MYILYIGLCLVWVKWVKWGGVFMVNSECIEVMYDFLDHKNQSELRVIHPTRKNSKGETLVISDFCNSFEEVLDKCVKYEQEGFNIYIGLNERKLNCKNDADVISITTIGHDIDCHSEDFTKDKAWQMILEYVEKTKELGFYEPLIIDSGWGFWMLNKVSIDNTTENINKIKQYAENLNKEYGFKFFDPTAYNPSRICRVAGTLNFRDVKNPVQSKIVKFPTTYGTDFKFTEILMNTKAKHYKNNTTNSTVSINGDCKFMDYILSNNLPDESNRHNIVARNFAAYIFNNPNREKLIEQYNSIQETTDVSVDNWITSIKKNDKYGEFRCADLFNYQKNNKINGVPLLCLECGRFKEFCEPKGLNRAFIISEIAKKEGLENCPFCSFKFHFDDSKGLFYCKKCKKGGAVNKFIKLCAYMRSQ